MRPIAALRSVAAPQQSAIACFTLSAFDLELTTIAENVASAGELVDLVSRLQPRPLGTDLSLVERALAEAPRTAPAGVRDRPDDRGQRHAGAALDGRSGIAGRRLDRRVAAGAERRDRRSRGQLATA